MRRLIRSELDRCQSILDSMSGRAGAGLPTTLEPMTPSAIAHLVQERLTDARRQRLTIDIEPATPNPAATGAEMVQAISSLLKNAFDASARCRRRGPSLRRTWRDGADRSAGSGHRDVTRRETSRRRALLHDEGTRSRARAWVCSWFERLRNARVVALSSKAPRARRPSSRFLRLASEAPLLT